MREILLPSYRAAIKVVQIDGHCGNDCQQSGLLLPWRNWKQIQSRWLICNEFCFDICSRYTHTHTSISCAASTIFSTERGRRWTRREISQRTATDMVVSLDMADVPVSSDTMSPNKNKIVYCVFLLCHFNTMETSNFRCDDSSRKVVRLSTKWLLCHILFAAVQ